jgi:hypothetical protein
MFCRTLVLCLLNYVMTLSVAPIVQPHCCMVNYEVERMWKEAIMA